MRYLYDIIGIRMLCEMPFPVVIKKESKDFLQEGNAVEDIDINFCFHPVETLESLPDNGVWNINQYYVEDPCKKRIYFCPSRDQKPYARITWQNDKLISCHYVNDKSSYLGYSHNICDLIGLEMLLLTYNGLLLHSSFIRWNGQGILFSAPSGTGKSTQADLWVKYKQAEIINGDRAGLRKLEDGWAAFGLPYAGSSGIYRNESAPVTAIVVLRQAKENQIRPLGPAEAIRYLYPEITIHQWDKDFVDQAMDLLTDLLFHVPVYLLECLPDQGAVELVKHTIFKSEKKGG